MRKEKEDVKKKKKIIKKKMPYSQIWTRAETFRMHW